MSHIGPTTTGRQRGRAQEQPRRASTSPVYDAAAAADDDDDDKTQAQPSQRETRLDNDEKTTTPTQLMRIRHARRARMGPPRSEVAAPTPVGVRDECDSKGAR
jgi:hypothetical protein